MKKVIGDLVREKMEQKKAKENQSRKKYRRTHKGKRFKEAVKNISVTWRGVSMGFYWRGKGGRKNRGWMSVVKR